jgi:hypothetical protein
MKRLAILILTASCASTPAPTAQTPSSSSSSSSSPTTTPPPPAGTQPIHVTALPAPPSPPPKPRSVDAIVADAVNATGGKAAWDAHKSVRMKLKMTFQGMGIAGTGERFASTGDKSLVVTDLPAIGTVREGSNGKVFWSQDPVNGLRILEGAEADQARIESAWNAEERLQELYAKIEPATEAGPNGAPLECLVLTPKQAPPTTNCYDPVTHLQVLQKGTRSTAQGDVPFTSYLKDWREVGGVKMAYAVDTQAGPVMFTAEISDVKFDVPVDDKMFEPPVPKPAAPPAKATGKHKAPAPGK